MLLFVFHLFCFNSVFFAFVDGLSFQVQDGVGASSQFQRAFPVSGATVNMTSYSSWPSLVPGTMGQKFSGGVFDGQVVWLIPSFATAVVTVNLATGSMKNFSTWPAGLVASTDLSIGNNAFEGGVFDGRYVWMSPSSSKYIVRIDTAAATIGTMIGVVIPSGTASLGSKTFLGCGFDGSKVMWLVPRYATTIVYVNTSSVVPQAVTFSGAWPASPFSLATTSGALAGAGYDGGKYLWLAPHTANAVVRLDVSNFSNPMVSYNSFPAGLTGISGTLGAFFGVIFDGIRYMYLIPFCANGVVQIDVSAQSMGSMRLFNAWPSGITNIGNFAFAGGAFDGRFVWLASQNSNMIIRLDTKSNNGTMLNFTTPITATPAYLGGLFDGRCVALVPFSQSSVLRICRNSSSTLFSGSHSMTKSRSSDNKRSASASASEERSITRSPSEGSDSHSQGTKPRSETQSLTAQRHSLTFSSSRTSWSLTLSQSSRRSISSSSTDWPSSLTKTGSLTSTTSIGTRTYSITSSVSSSGSATSTPEQPSASSTRQHGVRTTTEKRAHHRWSLSASTSAQISATTSSSLSHSASWEPATQSDSKRHAHHPGSKTRSRLLLVSLSPSLSLSSSLQPRATGPPHSDRTRRYGVSRTPSNFASLSNSHTEDFSSSQTAKNINKKKKNTRTSTRRVSPSQCAALIVTTAPSSLTGPTLSHGSSSSNVSSANAAGGPSSATVLLQLVGGRWAANATRYVTFATTLFSTANIVCFIKTPGLIACLLPIVPSLESMVDAGIITVIVSRMSVVDSCVAATLSSLLLNEDLLVAAGSRQASLASAVQATGTVTAAMAAASSVAGGVGASGSAQSLAVLGMISCASPGARKQTSSLRYLLSPFVDSGYSTMVIGNFVIVVAVTVLQGIVIAALFHLTHSTWIGALGSARFPSLALSVAAFLFQGTVFAGLLLINAAGESSAGEIFLGVAALLLCALMPIGTTWYIRRDVLSKLAFILYSHACPGAPERSWLSRLLIPDGFWDSLDLVGNELEVGRRFGRLVNSFRDSHTILLHSYPQVSSYAFNMAAVLLASVSCQLMYGVLLLITLASCAFVCWTKPHRTPCLNVLSAASFAVLGVVCGVQWAEYANLGNGSLEVASASVSILQLCIIVVRAIYDVALFIGHPKWLKNRSKTHHFDAAAHQGTDAEDDRALVVIDREVTMLESLNAINSAEMQLVDNPQRNEQTSSSSSSTPTERGGEYVPVVLHAPGAPRPLHDETGASNLDRMFDEEEELARATKGTYRSQAAAATAVDGNQARERSQSSARELTAEQLDQL